MLPRQAQLTTSPSALPSNVTGSLPALMALNLLALALVDVDAFWYLRGLVSEHHGLVLLLLTGLE